MDSSISKNLSLEDLILAGINDSKLCFIIAFVYCACESIQCNCNRSVHIYAICICVIFHNHCSIFSLYNAIIFAVQFSTILFSFQPQLHHCCCQISVFLEKIYNLKLFFFLFFYQKGKSSRIRFYFRNKVRFHGRKKQSLGVEKVCSFSIALLKCPYALINLSMFGSSQWGK